ncbi:MAG: gluconolactonase [Mycobacterium sp.]|jgi:hypothetical protein|nr:gluconolactonase [Mycobacterium sp.]
METFVTGLGSPECPIVLDNGDLLLVEMTGERRAVTRVDANTRELVVVHETGGQPNGLVRDRHGTLWVGEAFEHAIIKLDAEGSELLRITRHGDEEFRWPNDRVPLAQRYCHRARRRDLLHRLRRLAARVAFTD